MIKRIVIPATAAAALLLGGAGAALASEGGHVTPPKTTTGSFGPYNDYTFGSVTCTEVHHPSNTNLPAGKGKVPAGSTTQGGWDQITCQIANPNPATPKTGVVGWNSDWGTQFDQNGGQMAYKVSQHGMVYHGVAWYPTG